MGPCRSGGQKIQDERRLHASMALVRPDSSQDADTDEAKTVTS
jgi:hypothetical protein